MKKLLPEFSFRVFGHLQTLSFAMPARLEQPPSHPLVCFQGFLEFAKRTNKIAQFFHKMWQFFTLPEFRHLGGLKRGMHLQLILGGVGLIAKMALGPL